MSRLTTPQKVNNRNKWVAFGFAVFGLSSFASAYWLVYYKSKNNHIDPSKPLPASAQYRGLYMRSGFASSGPPYKCR
jgi:hypothetical protein